MVSDSSLISTGAGRADSVGPDPARPGAANIVCHRGRVAQWERSLHTREVAGSKPAAPIVRKPCICGAFVVLGGGLSHRLGGQVGRGHARAPAGLVGTLGQLGRELVVLELPSLARDAAVPPSPA